MTLAPVRARTRLAAFVSLSLLLAPACSRREAPSGDAAPPLPKDAVVVKVSYGSEKKGFLTDSIEAFHASNPRTAGGKPIRIEAVAEGSAESMEAILAGQSDVHVWSPASSLLVDVLNARWAEKQGLGGGKPLVGEAPPLVLSPVVVAMWKPMAEALGWPGKPLGWSDLASLASSKEGWAKYGKPQWGEFKLGHTHPRFSNSGGVALVAATYAGAGKTRDLTLDDAAKAAPFVKQVQSSIVHYGRSTGFFAEKMLTRGPAYLSAAVLYESNVAESYIDPKYKDRPFDVVAIYPKEGTFWADHPWAVLDLPTVTAGNPGSGGGVPQVPHVDGTPAGRADAVRVPAGRHGDPARRADRRGPRPRPGPAEERPPEPSRRRDPPHPRLLRERQAPRGDHLRPRHVGLDEG